LLYRQPPKTRIGSLNFVDFGIFFNFSDKNVVLVEDYAFQDELSMTLPSICSVFYC